MGALFSKKNKEVFSTPLGLNNPVTVQVLGICSALAAPEMTSSIPFRASLMLPFPFIGAFRNGDYGILQCSDFIVAQDHPQPYPYHRPVGGSCSVGDNCK